MKFRLIWTLAVLLLLGVVYLVISSNEPTQQPADNGGYVVK